MSAIAGLLRTDRHAVEVEPAERMAAALGRRESRDDGSYRSPDGRAALAARGAPLLSNHTHDIWLALDGEIHNHRPLRHTLELLGHRFRGESAAEVALHAYEQWELDFTAHLHGAFALALWDDRRDRLVLARDRLGRKPLFVARHRGRLGFASGIGALLDGMDLPRRLDPAALHHYLTLGCVPAPTTLVAGISALAAGEMLVAGRDGGPHRHRWRDLAPGGGTVPPQRALPAERHAGNLRTLMECAVADRLAEDGGMALWLTPEPASGALAAIATRLAGAAAPAVVVGDRDDGAAFATMHALAAFARLDPVEVRLSPAEVVEALPRLIVGLASPVATAEILSAWFAAEAAAHSRLRTLLAPVGAGQILLDRPTYAPLRPHGWRRFLHWLAAPARALPSPLFAAPTGLLALELPPQTLALPSMPGWLAEDVLAAAGADDLALRVADGDALALDSMAQAHGLTARLPFLDEALVDYALAVPGRVRAHPRLLGDLVPAGLLGRRVPPALPLAQWLAGDLGRLLVERAARWPVLERRAVASLMESHRANPVHADRLWALLVLAEWCAGLGLDDVAPANAGAELVYSRS